MALSLTESAAEHVLRQLKGHGHAVGLRVGVRTAGCSGLTYVLDFAEEIAPGDHVFEERGVRLVVDPDSLAYIDGSVLDYVEDGLNRSFKFRNPNVKDTCGCGESFNV